jgi:hypothetical protein
VWPASIKITGVEVLSILNPRVALWDHEAVGCFFLLLRRVHFNEFRVNYQTGIRADQGVYGGWKNLDASLSVFMEFPGSGYPMDLAGYSPGRSYWFDGTKGYWQNKTTGTTASYNYSTGQWYDKNGALHGTTGMSADEYLSYLLSL